MTPIRIIYYSLLVASCPAHSNKTKTKDPRSPAPTSDDPCPLSGPRLDLCKSPSEVTGVIHLQ